jgi:hypothetical protein
MKYVAIITAFIVNSNTSAFAQKTGIGTNSPSNMLEVISAVGPSSSASILGTNNGTTGTAIIGSSAASNTSAVTGYSTNGYGVQGYTNNNIGVSGLTSTGTALYAVSNSGYALQVSGNLKFAGGNTNPSLGAVLTSDATGNATWKKSNVAFLGLGTLGTSFAAGVFKKVEFVNESYDLQNNLEIYSGSVTATSSVFTAPVSGIYHFSSVIHFSAPNSILIRHAQIKLVKNSSALATHIGHPYNYDSNSGSIYLQITGDFHLNANDKVWIEAAQFYAGNVPVGLNTSNNDARFSGHLVTAD